MLDHPRPALNHQVPELHNPAPPWWCPGTGVGLLYHVRPWEYDAGHMDIRSIEGRPRISYLPLQPTILHRRARAHVHSSSSRLLRSMVSEAAGPRAGDRGGGRENISRLSEIAVRYTVGLGLFEVLLSDDRIEDVYVDARPRRTRAHNHQWRSTVQHNAVCRCSRTSRPPPRRVKVASRLRQTSGHPSRLSQCWRQTSRGSSPGPRSLGHRCPREGRPPCGGTREGRGPC